MKDQLAQQVRRVEATDPIAAARRYDYADAFEVRLPEPDPYSPETWVRAGLAATGGVVKRIVGLLGLRRAPGSSADHVGGFQVIESGPDVVHLETTLPLMRVVLVGRRVEPTRRMLTTVLHYERPVLARLVWAIVGLGHRRTAPQVITSKISTR
jgi:transglutaminase-like putative cysteine protease